MCKCIVLTIKVLFQKRQKIIRIAVANTIVDKDKTIAT